MASVSGPVVENEVESIRQARGYRSNLSMTIGGASNIDFSASTGTFKFPAGATSGQLANVLDQTTTTVLTASQSGSMVLWDAAAGFTITLPAPTIGLQYSFAVATSVTSSNHKLITNTGTVFLYGGVAMGEATGSTTLEALFNGSSHVSILMNGTTTGGLIGTAFNVTCTSATEWLIEGIVAGSGTLATPASTS